MQFKKISIGLATLSTIATPIATVISCDNKNKEDGKITLLDFASRKKLDGALAHNLNKSSNLGWKSVIALDGNGHSVKDNSFNEYSYNGMKDLAISSIMPSLSPDFIKPATDDQKGFTDMYGSVNVKSLLIAPGFLHIDNLKSSAGKEHLKGKAVILLDGDVEASNIAAVEFKSNQAGFLAGYMAGVYLNLKYNDFKKDGLKVATFGGLNISGVTPYMMGFQNGVKYFNEHKPSKFVHKIEFIDNGAKSDYFSGGFASGGGKAISEKLVAAGADLIFPVAGPQTQDVKNAILKANSNAKIIGVDVAQEKITTFNKYVVFSALKDLKTAVIKMTKIVTGTKLKSDVGFNGFEGFGGLTIGDLDNALVGVSQGVSSNTDAKTAFDEANKEAIKTAAKSSNHNPLAFDY